jgi:putative heme-binding domain-containing protein
VLAALLGSAPLAAPLVDALERGTLAASELDATARDALRRVQGDALRKRVETFLARTAPPDRAGILKEYRAALALAGDPRRGGDLFAKNCQTCHLRQGKGNRVGPDLSGVGGRPASALLNDILDPNQEVAPDFVSFVLVTKRGQVLSGLLAEETAASLKLRRAEGAEETVLRSEIEEFRSSGRSLMPEGLEQALRVQGVADVLAFLRQP